MYSKKSYFNFPTKVERTPINSFIINVCKLPKMEIPYSIHALFIPSHNQNFKWLDYFPFSYICKSAIPT